jgi:N-acetylglucosamine-6-sulfatase
MENLKKHKNLIFLSGTSFVIFSGMSCVERTNNESLKPNIIFILTDDQAWNTLNRDGRYPFLKTPNIDLIADEGMVFRNAFCTTSLSSPSRACIMTGCYAHTNGVYVNGYADPDPKLPLLPTILQQNGYETAFVGKWHMKHGDGPRKGFDYWLSFEGVGQYTDPPLNENGTKFIKKGYITDILNDYALQWLKKPREKPFCIFIWHKVPHTPFTPAPCDSAAVSDAMVPNYKNWYDDMATKPQWLRRAWMYGVHYQNWKNSQEKPVPDKIIPRRWDPQNRSAMNYLRTLLAVDKGVGEIREYLEDNHILDNTIIIYGSDNGFFLGAHQFGDKRLMYDESLRVPLIIRYPKVIKPGTTNSNMVLNIDITPTIIELAGGKVPENMQGTSMVPLLRNEF